MTSDEFLVFLAADGERIAEIGSTSIGSRVPSCPEWEVADLMTHVGWVHRFLTYLAELPDGERPTKERLAPLRLGMRSWTRPDTDLVPWFREGFDNLVQALQEAPASKTIHTPYGTHQPTLLTRRAATETAIHRWDAEGAVGAPSPLAPDLAANAVDEFLELLVPMFFKRTEFAGTGETILLQGPDNDAWLITVQADTTDWRRSSDETDVDVTLRGSASDLYLYCWGRQPAEPVEVEGDKEVLARWQAAAAF